MFNLNNQKLQLSYPCQWVYKVIGAGQEQVLRAIVEVARGYDYDVTLSNRSKTGKYCCLNLEMTVDSEEIRTEIYTALRNHPTIRIVL